MVDAEAGKTGGPGGGRPPATGLKKKNIISDDYHKIKTKIIKTLFTVKAAVAVVVVDAAAAAAADDDCSEVEKMLEFELKKQRLVNSHLLLCAHAAGALEVVQRLLREMNILSTVFCYELSRHE